MTMEYNNYIGSKLVKYLVPQFESMKITLKKIIKNQNV